MMENEGRDPSAMAMGEALKGVKLGEEEKRIFYTLIALAILLVGAIFLVFDIVSPSTQSTNALNPAQCGSVFGAQIQYSCIQSIANKTKNASVCNYLQGSEQQYCVYSVARAANNIALCSLINSTSYYYPQCVLSLNKNWSNIAICGKLQGSYALGCVYNFSVATNYSNIGACNALAGGTAAECKYINYYRNALAKKNSTLCGYLQATMNSTTMVFISKSMSQNASFSNAFYYATLNTSPRNYCYYQVAQIQNSISTCGYISDYFKQICTASVINANISRMSFNLNATNLTSACGSYSNTTVRSACRIKYVDYQAIKQNTISPCRMLNYSIQTDYCVFNYALNKTNQTACQYITNSTIQSVCKYSTKRQ